MRSIRTTRKRSIRLYEDLGVDEYIYYASMGLSHEAQKRSLKLFCDEVIPAFQ